MPSRPDALVLCYPVISFSRARHQGSIENLLGADATAEQVAALSLETLVTAATPPTFLWHTADDEKVPVANSLLFASALDRAGVPFGLHVYPHGRHGLGLATDDPVVGSWTTLCATWLATVGFGAGSAGRF
jgi:acetyl esterase/lipase